MTMMQRACATEHGGQVHRSYTPCLQTHVSAEVLEHDGEVEVLEAEAHPLQAHHLDVLQADHREG